MKLCPLIALSFALVGGVFSQTALADSDSEETVYSMKDVDKKPQVLSMSRPAYPKALKKTKVEGKVVIEFVLSAKAKVVSPTIYTSTNEGFDTSALESIKKSKWRAAKKDGKAVAVKVRVPVRFDL